MLSLFQRELNVRGVVFTTTPSISSFCEELGLSVISNFSVNPYGLPYIGDMYNRSALLYNAMYYGYLNADILLSTRIVEALKEFEEKWRYTYSSGMVGFIYTIESRSSCVTMLTMYQVLN